ncbi:MAG: hypothetical protein ACTSVV_09140 [Promethearchaeota archaeon]
MTQDYSKYHDLEKYLFKDVSQKFKKEGCLNASDFFCIVIWKANRSKTKIKKKLLKLSGKKNIDKICKELTLEIARQKSDEDKMKLLLEKWKFRLPMATAILTVLYPKNFTVYDVRVREQLKMKDFTNRKNQVDEYFSIYMPEVKKRGKGKSLRDKDRYFWGKSFAEDLNKLIKFKS